MYGGFVTFGICNSCISKKQNNKEYANEIFAKYEKTHPSTASKVSGCCDSAKNYT
jgi:hypothetical protein